LLKVSVYPLQGRTGIDITAVVNLKGSARISSIGGQPVSGMYIPRAVGYKKHGVIPKGVFGVIEVEYAPNRIIRVVIIGHRILVTAP
jgi:hypothetical protein